MSSCPCLSESKPTTDYRTKHDTLFCTAQTRIKHDTLFPTGQRFHSQSIFRAQSHESNALAACAMHTSSCHPPTFTSCVPNTTVFPVSQKPIVTISGCALPRTACENAALHEVRRIALVNLRAPCMGWRVILLTDLQHGKPKGFCL